MTTSAPTPGLQATNHHQNSGHTQTPSLTNPNHGPRHPARSPAPAPATASRPPSASKKPAITCTPRRIQLRRTPGWRLRDISPTAVIVTRPRAFANPFYIGKWGDTHQWRGWYVWPGREPVPDTEHFDTKAAAAARSVELHRAWLDGDTAFPDSITLNTITYTRTWVTDHARDLLANKDLACWCPLTDADGNPIPCHADTLLRIANGGESP